MTQLIHNVVKNIIVRYGRILMVCGCIVGGENCLCILVHELKVEFLIIPCVRQFEVTPIEVKMREYRLR